MDWRLFYRRLPVLLAFVGLGAALSITIIIVATRSTPLTLHQVTAPLNSAVTVTPIALEGVSGLPKLLSKDAEGQRWAIIGGALLEAGFVKASIPALKRAVALDNENAMLHVALGEALALSNNGWITESAKAEFDFAIKADPNDLIARFYMAHWLLQTGKAKLALVKWVGLMRTVGDDKVWYDRLWDVMPQAADQVGISKLALKALCTASM
jgi:tetratricopeptide (TPR) repeat protein